MNGMLGKGTPPCILGNMSTGGGLMSLMPTETQGPAAPGSEAYAPGVMLWRQIMQAMSQGGPAQVLDPANAQANFSPELLSFLAPQYQQQPGEQAVQRPGLTQHEQRPDEPGDGRQRDDNQSADEPAPMRDEELHIAPLTARLRPRAA